MGFDGMIGVKLRGDRSPLNTPPSDFTCVQRTLTVKSARKAFFFWEMGFPARKMTPVAAAHVAGNDYRSGRSAPDTPGKLAKGSLSEGAVTRSVTERVPLKAEVARSAGGVPSARQIRIYNPTEEDL